MNSIESKETPCENVSIVKKIIIEQSYSQIKPILSASKRRENLVINKPIINSLLKAAGTPSLVCAPLLFSQGLVRKFTLIYRFKYPPLQTNMVGSYFQSISCLTTLSNCIEIRFTKVFQWTSLSVVDVFHDKKIRE